MVPLLSKTYLDCLPPRIVRFRLRLMQFNYTKSRPWKMLYTADTLSSAPVDSADKTALVDAMFVQAVISHLPVSISCLDNFCKAQNYAFN